MAKSNLGGNGMTAMALALLLTRQEDSTIPDMIDRVLPSVVTVVTDRPVASNPLRFWFGPEVRPPEGHEKGVGSGVVVGSDGVILTNNHVVDASKEIKVVLSNRREFRARVVGVDPRTDLAVLRIDARELAAIPFADSSKARIGQTVFAIGNPLGMGQTVSRGIISGKGRANVGVADFEDLMQTDAAVNPGNSGGALVNVKGELVGIITAIASKTGRFEGIGFAIPSNMAREVMEILQSRGRVSRGQIGILIQDMTPELVRSMPDAPERGILVSQVLEGSPAEKAGLRKNDVILRVNGEPVDAASRLRNRVSILGAGAQVTLSVWREGKSLDVSLRLRPEEEEAIEKTTPAPGRSDSGVLEGIWVAPATGDLLKRHGYSGEKAGLVVTRVDPDQAGAFGALKEGDLIVEVNKKPVRSVADMRSALREGANTVELHAKRPGSEIYVSVTR